MNGHQRLMIKNLLDAGIMREVEAEIRMMLMPDLVSEQAEKRDEAARVYRTLGRVEQILYAMAARESNYAE